VSRQRPIQEKYAVAMVLLRMAGAHEHTINQYRTITPKKMKQFLPEINEITRRMNEGKR
jgi:hypothetical protein